MSSRDTLAIRESAWACGWVDGSAPSARLRLDLKLIGSGAGHRSLPWSLQPAASTAAWRVHRSLARSSQPGRAHSSARWPVQRLRGHCCARGGRGMPRAAACLAGQARPTMVPRTA